MAFFVCLLVASTSAQDAASQAAEPKASVNPGDVNLRVSRVYILVETTGLGHRRVIEGKLVSGSLLLGATASAGQLVFDMQSFDSDTPAARRYVGLEGTTGESTRAIVNDNMKGSHVLNVAKFPTATFDVHSAIATGQTSKQGNPTYQLTGMFNLHGKANTVVIIVEVEQARGWLHVRGSFAIKQTSYGITPFSMAFGAFGVTDALRIHGDLWVAPSRKLSMLNIPKRK